MHIVFTSATYAPHAGGAESAIRDLATALAADGHKISVITRHEPASLPPRERRNGVDIVRLPYPPVAIRRVSDVLALIVCTMRTVLQLVSFARRERVHVLCIGLVGMDSVFALLLRSMLGCRLIVYLHGGELRAYVRVSAFVRSVLRRCLRSCEAVIAVSEALRREASAFAPGIEAKISVIPNAIDRCDIDTASPYAHQRRYLLYVGRLHPVKNLPTLIAGFATAATTLPDVDLLLAGVGPEELRLRHLVHAHGLDGRVVFLGAQSHAAVAALIKGSELLLLTSLAEGLPVVVMEALAAGKMTIATRVKGADEIIHDGINGALFTEGDAAALSALMIRYSVPSARREIETAIQRAGLGRFDVARTKAEHLAVYGCGEQLRFCLVSLFYAQDPARTGLSTYYHNLRSSLTALGHTVHLITASDSPTDTRPHVIFVPIRHRDLLEGPDSTGLTGALRRVLARFAFAAQAYRQVRRLDRTAGLDLVIAPELFAQGLFIAFGMGRKLMTRIHTPSYIADRYNRRYRREWIGRAISLPELVQLRWSRCASVASSHLRRIVHHDWHVPEDRIRIIPNSVQTEWVQSLAAAQRRRVEGDYLLFVGRLEQRKGAAVIAAALPDILARHAGIKMVFAGPDQGWCERILRDNPRDRHRIVFLGALEKAELFGVVRDARLVLLPSLVENLSNAGLEAMALGRAVIGTRDTAFEEIIADGVDGFLIQPNDPRALAAKVVECLQSGTLDAVGARAAERVAALDSRLVARRYVDLFRDTFLS